MTLELWALFASMIWGLIHVSVASFAFKAQVGNRYTVGPRDEAIPPTGVAGRLERALRNFLETFPLFAASVLLLAHTGNSGTVLSEAGALLYVAGRVLFLPLYAAGVPWLRTLSWNAATLGLAMVMAAIVWR